jgi:hypothetical protein
MKHLKIEISHEMHFEAQEKTHVPARRDDGEAASGDFWQRPCKAPQRLLKKRAWADDCANIIRHHHPEKKTRERGNRRGGVSVRD